MSKLMMIDPKILDWWMDAKANPLILPSLLVAAGLAVFDQVTKYWVVNIIKLPERLVACSHDAAMSCRQIPVISFFDLTYVENRGASFGMLAGGLPSRIILSTISLAIIAAMVIWLGRVRKPVQAAAIAFIVGGALGNLIDRVMLGFVVDFLDFSGLRFPWVFNVADMAVNIGVGFLLFDAFLDSRKEVKQ